MGTDNDFSYEGMVARYNADLANNLGNLLSRVATVVEKKCGGVGPAPSVDGPLVGRGGSRRGRGIGGVGRRPAQRGPGGHVAAHPRHQRPPGGERALEGRAGTRSSTGSSATRWRRCASSPCSPAPAIPSTRADDLGAHRAAGRLSDQRVPDALAWGGYPGGLPVTKAAPLFPRRQA